MLRVFRAGLFILIFACVAVADESAFSALVEVAKKALPDASGSAAA